METATRDMMINILAANEKSLVFFWSSDLSSYLMVDNTNFIRKIAESNVTYFEYEISRANTYIFIQSIK